jgi:hypothetical protein
MSGFFDKVKSYTKQAADQTSRAAKIAKIKMNMVSLNSEKDRNLKSIGLNVFTMVSSTGGLDPEALRLACRDNVMQINQLNEKIQELENEIAGIQAASTDTEVGEDEE